MFTMQACIMTTDQQENDFAVLTGRASQFIDTLSLAEQEDMLVTLQRFLRACDEPDRAEALAIWLNCDPDYRRYSERRGWTRTTRG